MRCLCRMLVCSLADESLAPPPGGVFVSWAESLTFP